MHMAGHVDKWCEVNCDARNFSELDNVSLCIVVHICDSLRENLAWHMGSACYSRNVRFQYLRSKNVKVQFLSYSCQRTFLLTLLPSSTEANRKLQRRNKPSYFDPPSRPSCCTRSPLLWALIRILYLATSRFIKLLYVRSPF